MLAMSASRKRLAWRALRATSDMPFLLRVEFLERDHRQVDVVFLEAEQAVGSCISTLVSSTNSLAGPSPRGFLAARGGASGVGLRAAGGVVCTGASAMGAAPGIGADVS